MNEHYLFSAVRAFNTLAVLVHLCYIPGKSYLDLLRLLLMLYNNNNNNNSNIYVYYNIQILYNNNNYYLYSNNM